MYEMRSLYMFFLIILTYETFGQVPAGLTIVVKNPAWQAEDAAKESLEKADRIRQITTLTEQVNIQKESLQTIRDATVKLKKINRKVANYHNLELAVAQVSDSYTRVLNSLKTLSDHNCFEPSEYHIISESMMGLLSQTSYAITKIGRASCRERV